MNFKINLAVYVSIVFSFLVNSVQARHHSWSHPQSHPQPQFQSLFKENIFCELGKELAQAYLPKDSSAPASRYTAYSEKEIFEIYEEVAGTNNPEEVSDYCIGISLINLEMSAPLTGVIRTAVRLNLEINYVNELKRLKALLKTSPLATCNSNNKLPSPEQVEQSFIFYQAEINPIIKNLIKKCHEPQFTELF